MKGLTALEPRSRAASRTRPAPRNSLIYRSAAPRTGEPCSAFAASRSSKGPAGVGSALASPRLPRPGWHQHRRPRWRVNPPRSAAARARNPADSPVPPPTHRPVNRRRFPGASPGCGRRKFPAMRHLPTPSVEVFRLAAAPRVGRGALLSHTLPSRPPGLPSTEQPQGRSLPPSRCCWAGGRVGTPLPRRGPTDPWSPSPLTGSSRFLLLRHEPSGKETPLRSEWDWPHGSTHSISLT